MLHVLLVILKVVGIVILVLLLTLLLLLTLVLLVPVRYQVYAKKDTDMYLKANASWLFHLIHLRLYIGQDKVERSFKIVGISTDRWMSLINRIKKLFSFPRKRKTNRLRKQKEKKKQVKVKKESESSLNTVMNESKKDLIPNEQEPEQEPVKARLTKDIPSNEKIEKEAKKIKKSTFSLKKWFGKIKKSIIHFFKTFKNLIDKIIGFIKNANDKWEQGLLFLFDENNKAAFDLFKVQILLILKHIKPRKYKVNLRFGTGDPALTGQVLGIFGMFMPFYKNNAVIIPDFENAVFEGNVFIKGRIRLAKAIRIGLKLYRDENIKRCLNMIMD